MSYSYETWNEGQRKQLRGRLDERLGELRLAQQAEVAAKLLTEDSHWNAFLQILQTEINYCRDRLRQIEERVCSAAVVSSDEVQSLRMDAIRLRTIAETLERVLELPTSLREKGEKARDILRTYTSD
ncbi:hypothetical protein AMJ82_11565 [candidate division TA06 bacterium SM23_40]|uniref:Uncharacterized protein n=1 Tax=candidate division TA06 bacterium SM23_40 TaxID=1703774 RepID=A0A0S8G4N6_UNCT6|nr:MAG: hypothetical protein AMJ82_11565 [candidate division TA06 bacterium SM23_40]